VIHYIVAGLALAGAWTLLVTVSPVGRCLRCKGKRVIPKGKGVKPCTWCKATGRAYRPGAVLVHRLIREHAGPWVRDRFRDAAERRTGDGS